MISLKYKVNTAAQGAIAQHLFKCSDSFSPALSSYINIDEYAHKLHDKSVRFEAWHDSLLVGLIAVYELENQRTAFISNVSIDPDYTGSGYAGHLLGTCTAFLEAKKCRDVTLEVNTSNARAIRFYNRNGFIASGELKDKFIMKLDLANHRDYNAESLDATSHRYAYDFDFDVMHGYMIKSFEPFFNKGNVLELGSFQGNFTERLLHYFDAVTCIEASDAAANIAKNKLGAKVDIHVSLFEEADLPTKYDNIILTHVLEHIDRPVQLIEMIRQRWLSEKGSLFIACPNANAASRRIGVKMGLLSHNSTITQAESDHGHRITYSLDTLIRDVTEGGLELHHQSGIFFKALANFQWDRLLKTDIICQQYLDGCFALGKEYPDLCSSIMVIAKHPRPGAAATP